MKDKIYLCKDCDCCPAVEFRGDDVHIGEDDNLVVLKKHEWNILVEKITSGELGAL